MEKEKERVIPSLFFVYFLFKNNYHQLCLANKVTDYVVHGANFEQNLVSRSVTTLNAAARPCSCRG